MVGDNHANITPVLRLLDQRNLHNVCDLQHRKLTLGLDLVVYVAMKDWPRSTIHLLTDLRLLKIARSIMRDGK